MAKTFSDEIREAIAGCGVSQYRIAKAAGIGQSILSKFLAGAMGMELATLDRVAAVLDLHVTAGKAAARKLAAEAPGPGRPAVEKPLKRKRTR